MVRLAADPSLPSLRYRALERGLASCVRNVLACFDAQVACIQFESDAVILVIRTPIEISFGSKSA